MTNKDIEKMLNENCELDMSHIKKEDILAKAKQEMYFSTAPAKKENKSFPLLFTKKGLVPAIAGLAVCFTICAGMVGLYNENYQTVYIDVNPSVALTLNRFERVIDVEFLNEDAKTLLANTKLIGCNATDALSTVITACNTAGLVQDDSEIYISAVAKQEQKSEKLLEKLKGHAETIRQEENEAYSVNTYNSNKEEKKNSDKESLSPAKYKIIHDILDEDNGYTIDDLRDKKMGELNKIKKRLDDDDHDHDDDDRHENNRDEHDDDDDRDENDNKHDDDRNENHNNDKDDKPEDNKNQKPEGNDKDDDRDDDDDDEHDDDDDDDDDDDRDEHKENNKKPQKD